MTDGAELYLKKNLLSRGHIGSGDVLLEYSRLKEDRIRLDALWARSLDLRPMQPDAKQCLMLTEDCIRVV